jgi:MoaA/NifB/PqqE/SkfB family radical SAM enzyme
LLGHLRAARGAGVSLKIETDGSRIDDTAAGPHRLARRPVRADFGGRRHRRHSRRGAPGFELRAAIAAIERLSARGQPPQFVFVPTRHNLHEIVGAFDLAASLGCNAFVTGPMMRIGRAAAAWSDIAVSDSAWQHAAAGLRAHARSRQHGMELSIYPWDIVTEWRRD